MEEEFIKVYIDTLNKKIEDNAKNEIIYNTKITILDNNVRALLEQKKVQEEDFKKVYEELVAARENDNKDLNKEIEEARVQITELQNICNDLMQDKSFTEANLKEMHRKDVESIHDFYKNHNN